MSSELTAREASSRGTFRLTWYESFEEVDAAVATLRAMSPHARKLLSLCIESQGVRRTRMSPAGEALYDAGFVHVREDGYMGEVTITPALWGEEAMEAFEVGVGKYGLGG